MSTIAGLVKFTGEPVSKREIDWLLGPARRRAAEDPEIVLDGALAFAVQSDLADLSSRCPPNGVARGYETLGVFDGWLDNREALARVLGPLGASRAASDAELATLAYRKWERRYASRLSGDFASVIWDRQEERVTLARDRFGQRPLYFAHVPGAWLAFATEIRSLLALPTVDRRPYLPMVARYMNRTFSNEQERTFYMGIRRVPAASILHVNAEGSPSQSRRYWMPEHVTSRDPQGQCTDVKEEFRCLLTDAVRRHASRSTSPIGTTISGGLDSSSVSCLARDLAESEGRPLHSYSVVFPSAPPATDEAQYRDAVLDTGGFIPRLLPVSNPWSAARVAEQLEVIGQPFAGPALFVHWPVFEAAAHDGVHRVLNGVGGDVVISDGFEWLAYGGARRDWPKVRRDLAKVAERSGVAPHALAQHVGLMLEQLLNPHRSHRPTRTLLSRFLTKEACEVVADERIAGGEAMTTASPQVRTLLGGELQMYAELLDAAGARFSVAPSSPFLDQALIEFCLGLPAEWMVRDGWTRFALRASTTNVLPESVRWRQGKGDLNLAFFSSLGPEAARSLVNELPRMSGLELVVDVDRLRATLGRIASKRRLTREEQWCVYGVLVVGSWLAEEIA